MKVLFDLQAFQADNRNRGIARYSIELTRNIIKNFPQNEYFVFLNSHFFDTAQLAKRQLTELIPESNIYLWNFPSATCFSKEENDWNREAAEFAREAFITNIQPDIVYIHSLFEGFSNNSIVTVKKKHCNAFTVVTLYDLIPFVFREVYMNSPRITAWYEDRLANLKRADLLLSISNSSKKDTIFLAGIEEERIKTIHGGVCGHFRKVFVGEQQREYLAGKYGIYKKFVMYTGGYDARKNQEGLVIAFSKLPPHLRDQYQLVVSCAFPDHAKVALRTLGIQHGLDDSSIVFTDYVSEEDLVLLYNACHLFVFPSKYEGFGLPVVEAMRCGVPVIGSNTSSIPEIIDEPRALFDPNVPESIAAKIAEVLTDEQFRAELVNKSHIQSQKFTWDKVAEKAMEEIEGAYDKYTKELLSSKRHRIAYVSPVPDAESGIAAYSAEILPHLSQHYDIDIIVDQPSVREDILQTYTVHDSAWLKENKNLYSTVIYHFGNSMFHTYMLPLLDEVLGSVVLHDFYFSGPLFFMEITKKDRNTWVDFIYRSHGYHTLRKKLIEEEVAQTMFNYPCNLPLISSATSILSHSLHSLSLSELWYAYKGRNWLVIPYPKSIADCEKRKERHFRKELGFPEDSFIVCSFGFLGSTKLNYEILQAWNLSSLAKDSSSYLVFVGGGNFGYYYEKVSLLREQAPIPSNVIFTGWIDEDTYSKYLSIADIAVQLRTASRGESSSAVFDCMSYGIPTIINAHGSFNEIPDTTVWKLPESFSPEHLAETMNFLRANPQVASDIVSNAFQLIKEKHDFAVSIQEYKKAIDYSILHKKVTIKQLEETIREIPHSRTDFDVVRICEYFKRSFNDRQGKKTLFLDISALVHSDPRTGIQRVVRSILKEWLLFPPKGYFVEPVYARPGVYGYFYARSFVLGFLGIAEQCQSYSEILKDEAVKYNNHDIFFVLDLQPSVQTEQRAYIQELRMCGVKVKFCIHGIVPLTHPEYFPPESFSMHRQWLSCALDSDGLICTSQTTAEELAGWISRQPDFAGRHVPRIDWFHPGCDVENSCPNPGMPANGTKLLKKLKNSLAFLIVSTIEPRKGHVQVIQAFEMLWAAGSNAKLVIVGKHGWMMEFLIERLKTHPELCKRLFWFPDTSDEFLQKLYLSVTCLIAASYTDGFGLPLIEASYYNLPVIARDTSVFREATGNNAYYFSSGSAEGLAQDIANWVKLYKVNQHPKAEAVPRTSWKNAAVKLLDIVLQ